VQDTPAEEIAALRIAIPEITKWQNMSDEERDREFPPGFTPNPRLSSKD